MKKITQIIAAGFVLFAIAACGPSEEELNANATATIEAVHTRVATTLTAQALLATATPQPSPTNTVAPTATIPPASSPTAFATIGSLPTQGAPDSAVYMSDVTIPDNMVIAPGASFTKTWQLYNNGTTTWSTEYKIAYVSGEQMSGETTKITQSVAPGGTANVSVEMVAPTSPGTYKGYWRMQNAGGTFFGDQISVIIVVSDGTVTPTGSATPVGSVTPTATPVWSAYTIVEGDSCESIATEFNTTWDTIKAYNNLTEYCSEANFQTHIGETIQVPTWP
ncbi:MAG TPA: NBR1-Ig-like domain-containing protein [Anaerolineales bacterium]|nr:NBR1-Ig-like domain-containing protein [Anaerolineales bacterium]